MKRGAKDSEARALLLCNERRVGGKPGYVTLDPARTRLISSFVDTYLKLNSFEEQAFQAEVAKIEPVEREEIMEIVTSWMERGIEQGIERGIEQGERQARISLVVQQLSSLLGEIPVALQSTIEHLSNQQLETLALALLRFRTLNDLENWLQEHLDR